MGLDRDDIAQGNKLGRAQSRSGLRSASRGASHIRARLSPAAIALEWESAALRRAHSGERSLATRSIEGSMLEVVKPTDDAGHAC